MVLVVVLAVYGVMSFRRRREMHTEELAEQELEPALAT
jgi:hypothetical protein